MNLELQKKFDLRFETIVSSDNNVIIKLKTSPICLSVYADEFESVKNEVVSLNTLKWTEYCDAMQSKYDNGEFEKETMSLEDKYSLGFDNTDKTVTVELLNSDVYLTLSFEEFENTKAELLTVDEKDWVDYCTFKLSDENNINEFEDEPEDDSEDESEDEAEEINDSTLESEFGEHLINELFTSLFEHIQDEAEDDSDDDSDDEDESEDELEDESEDEFEDEFEDESEEMNDSTPESEFGSHTINELFTSLFENIKHIQDEAEDELEDEPEDKPTQYNDPLNGKFDMQSKIIITKNKQLTRADLLEYIDINIRAILKGDKFNISKYKNNKIKYIKLSEDDLHELRDSTYLYNIMGQTVFIDYDIDCEYTRKLRRDIVNTILSLNSTLKLMGVKIIPDKDDSIHKITRIKHKHDSKKYSITVII